MTQYDIKELRFHLQSLFLCCGSVMAGALEALLRCYRFNFPLEVTGKESPDYKLFVEISTKLGVRVTETEVTPNAPMKYYAWISDQSVSNQRAWIPDMTQREGDLHVMLPFYLKYHLTQLRKSDPSFKSPRVDNLYIMLIWAECFGLRAMSVSNRVLKDMVAWEAVGQLSVHQYTGFVSDEIRTVHGKVRGLANLAQLYLGFASGSGGWELTKGKEIAAHPFNRRSDEWAAVGTMSSGGATSPIPRLVRHYFWNLEDITIVTKNSWILHLRGKELCKGDLDRVHRCLIGRLTGKTEDELMGELGFTDHNEYYKWQISRAIDIDPSRLSDPLENWLKACDFFQIEPTLEALANFQAFKPDYSGQAGAPIHSTFEDSEANSAKVTEPANIPKMPASPANGEFRHSPDFRSVVSTSGQQFVLTAKQAHVVEILHTAWENGTPEVSHGHIIQEVFGEVAENRLKRLFANDSAWASLFEQGQGKGLIRLRVGPQQESD